MTNNAFWCHVSSYQSAVVAENALRSHTYSNPVREIVDQIQFTFRHSARIVNSVLWC